MEPLPRNRQEFDERMRLTEHDCDFCGSNIGTVRRILSPKNQLYLRFSCETCMKMEIFPIIVGDELVPK